jgi:hypothetical protein
MNPARRWLKRIAPAAEESAPAPQVETEAPTVEAIVGGIQNQDFRTLKIKECLVA